MPILTLSWDEDTLTPAEEFYYRLLTVGEQDEMELVETYLKANSLTALYDAVFIPVMTAAEIDYGLELLDEEQRLLIEQNLRDMIADLGSSPRVLPETAKDKDQASAAPALVSTCRVYCLPARAVRDELAGTMLFREVPICFPGSPTVAVAFKTCSVSLPQPQKEPIADEQTKIRSQVAQRWGLQLEGSGASKSQGSVNESKSRTGCVPPYQEAHVHRSRGESGSALCRRRGRRTSRFSRKRMDG